MLDKIARSFVHFINTILIRTVISCGYARTTTIVRGPPMKHHLLLLSLAATVLAGCATSPTGRSQLMVVSDSQMSQMGLAAFNDMRKQGKFVDAPRERAYASCVANALIAVLPPPWNTQRWEVQIIDDDTANAFALPGGRIGVNKGMFKLASNQDQLAVVLGHELSHVVARHGAERVSDNMAAQAAVAAGTIYAGSRGSDAGNAAALLGAGAQLGILLPFSRTQESEADTLGQRYMAQAGFDPRAAAVLWQKMGAQGGSKPPAFLSTHPSSGNRAQALERQAQQLLPTWQQARASGQAPNCKL
jgi:predicted Zn-dependent protease